MLFKEGRRLSPECLPHWRCKHLFTCPPPCRDGERFFCQRAIWIFVPVFVGHTKSPT